MREKEHEGILAPALPPKKGEPDPFPLKARTMLNQVIDQVRLIHKDGYRTRRLVAFAERKYKTVGSNGLEARPISKVRPNDRPEIEHYLMRRDIAMQLAEDMEMIRAKLDEASRDEPDFMKNLAWLTARLANLEEDRLKHITAMENILNNLSKEQMSRLHLVSKLAADGAKLTQAATQHEDRMEIARKVAATPSSDDLRARLAAKYNTTIEKVDQIMNAKEADADPDVT
jgi:hypothetical protein